MTSLLKLCLCVNSTTRGSYVTEVLFSLRAGQSKSTAIIVLSGISDEQACDHLWSSRFALDFVFSTPASKSFMLIGRRLSFTLSSNLLLLLNKTKVKKSV